MPPWVKKFLKAGYFQIMWEELSSFENLYLSYKKASKSRRSRPDIATFEISLEENLINLRDDLLSGNYEHGK